MQRHFPLSGAENFRDLGGYPVAGGAVAWRRVFRADRLTHLTAADADALSALSLKTIIDLRTPAEIMRSGPGRLASQATVLSHSLITANTVLRPALDYGAWLQAAGEPIAAVFAVMSGAEDPFPLVFHCTAGKDRTGIIAALLLSVLGVGAEDIVADYALTGQYFTPARAPDAEQLRRWHERMQQFFPGITERAAQHLLRAEPATMRALLADLDARHGGPAGYLDAIGVGAEARAVICDRLLAGQPSVATSAAG